MRRDSTTFDGHFAQIGHIGECACGNERGIALDHQLFEPGQAIQRTLADCGQRVGQRQRFQLCAVCERPRADGGHGVEQIHFPEGAVHEGLCTDGGELVVVSDGEVFDGLAVLEHAVAQADYRFFRDGEMGVNARLRAGVFGQHAVFVLIRALLRRLGGRVLRAPDAAGKPQRVHVRLPLLHLLTGAVGVQVDVVQIIAAREDVLAQHGRGRAFQNDILDVVIALERVRADRLKGRGQIEIGAHVGTGFKRVLADGLEPLRQFQRAFETGEIERVIADALHACQFQHAALIGVVECVAAYGLQRGGEADAAQRFAVIERAVADAFQSFGQLQKRQIGVTRERLRADGLHRRAADGLRDGKVGGVAVVGGDGAGGSVKVELIFHIAVVLHEHGIFAAGLDAHRAASVLKGRRVRLQLIVRDIGHRIIGKDAEAVHVDRRAHALEGDLAQRVAESERGVADVAHARRNGDLAQRVAAKEVHAVDDHKALGKRNACQLFARGDGVAPELKHRLGQRQGRDRIALEYVNADHVHREAVDFRRHDHVAARAVIAAEYGVVRVIIPVGGFGQCGYAENQHQQGENRD